MFSNSQPTSSLQHKEKGSHIQYVYFSVLLTTKVKVKVLEWAIIHRLMGNKRKKRQFEGMYDRMGASRIEGTPGKMIIWSSEMNPSLHVTLVINENWDYYLANNYLLTSHIFNGNIKLSFKIEYFTLMRKYAIIKQHIGQIAKVSLVL